MYHSSMLDPACDKDLTWSYLALSSFTCGFQNFCNLVQFVSLEISQGSRLQAWYIPSPWSPELLLGALHTLTSGKRGFQYFMLTLPDLEP